MMSNPVWMEHLVCTWHQTGSIGLEQILEALNTLQLVKLLSAIWDHRLYLLHTTQLLPEFAQLVPSTGGNGFLGEDCHCGNGKLSSFRQLLKCLFSRRSTCAGSNRVNDSLQTNLLCVRPPLLPSAFTLHSEQSVLSLYFGSTFVPSPWMFFTCQCSFQL